MKIIIVGIGKLGEYLTRCLVKDKNEVTIVDVDFTTSKDLIDNEDVNYVLGNGLDTNVLIEAGVSDSDLLISVMDKDEQNIICSMLAKKLGAKNTIARIRNQEYSDAMNFLKEELGLSLIINPESLTASHIAKTLSIPSALDATTFLKGKVQMVSLKVNESSKLLGLKINNISKKLEINIIVCAIERNGETIIPKGDTKIQLNDKIYIAGTTKDINKFLNYANLISQKTKKVMICGGSKTAIYLAKNLYELNIETKIIEINPERSKELAERLPHTLIINADASDENVLFEEGIASSDAFISLTGIDEENIVYSMYASIQKVPKIITKINHINLEGVEDKAGIDTIITPHRIAANQIVQYVRAIQNSQKSRCEAIYKFDNELLEMLEFNIKEDFKGLNKKIKDLNIKNNILIVSILREKNIIYPKGSEEIKLKDTIVVIDGTNSIKDINDIME